jgi:hypothetical protein
MEMTITMSATEQRRARVLTRILTGELTMAEGAATLGLSERQLWRLRVAFERDGPAGLVHGNRGRPSSRRIDPGLGARIIELRASYGEINDSHFSELLAEREAITVSRESLRQILRAAGLPSPRRRRSPQFRSRRARMAAEGLLLQLDGSRHDWLEGRGPWLTLVGAIDDATGAVPAAVFRDQEDAAGYLTILRDTIAARGIPGAIYRDRHGAFAPTNQHQEDAGEPAGRRSLSQVGRALVELGIGSIVAGSPQAKGRIERLWGTFQDRLVVELRLAGVTDLAGANAFLGSYLARHKCPLRGPGRRPGAGLAGRPVRGPAGAGSRLQVPPQGRPRPHDPARRTGPPAAPPGDRGRQLCRQDRRGPRSARWLDCGLRRRASAARRGRPRGAGQTPGPARRPRRARPRPSAGYDPLDAAGRSPVETDPHQQQALPAATDRFTWQLS